jgi:hypothetical protein
MWNAYSRVYLTAICIVCSLRIVGKHVKVEKGARIEEEKGSTKTGSGVYCVSLGLLCHRLVSMARRQRDMSVNS